MNKKEYFLFLSGLFSLDILIFVIPSTFSVWSEMGYLPAVEIRSFILALSIIVAGVVAIYIGIYLAQKIGLRLLLLENQYSFHKDIFMPAIVTASAYSALVLLVNKFIPIASLNFFSWNFLRYLTFALRFDIPILLFGLTLIAFIIKKIAQNASLSFIMPISIILLSLLIHAAPLIACLFFDCGLEKVIDLLYTPFTTAVLGVLFWKKGFEAALLCSIIITTILYFVVPLV